MINLENLTAEEQKEFARLTKKASQPSKKQCPKKDNGELTTPEEREIVDFFKELTPILIEASVDLKRKGLCPDDCGLTPFKHLIKP